MEIILATQQHRTAGLVLALLVILVGVLLLWAAIADPNQRFSAWYEENKDWPWGFWVVSRSARQFRFYHAALGVFFIAGGIAVLVALV